MQSSTKKRRIQSSDESGDDIPAPASQHVEVENNTPVSAGRKSSRIEERRNKKYEKPTRDKIWKKIPSSSEKRLNNITSRKVVNDMLRVHNRYNAEQIDIYDDGFIDDDESDFVKSADETDSEEEEEKSKKTKKIKESKIQNRRRRLKYESSSTDDESTKDVNLLKVEEDDQKIATENAEHKNGTDILSETKHTDTEKADYISVCSSSENVAERHPDTDSEEDLQIFATNLNSSRNKNVLLSDEEASECENDIDKADATNQKSKSKDSETIEVSDNSDVINSDSSDSSDNDSEAEMTKDSRADRQLSKKKNLFKSFKESQTRLKEKNKTLAASCSGKKK